MGNRNTVNGGAFAFDEIPDGDEFGIQPDWLEDPDQTGRQTTELSPVFPDEISLLFQISNGGGSFDVVITGFNGAEAVATVTGPDWFGPANGQPNIGAFPGTTGVDLALPDQSGENTLLISEVVLVPEDFTGDQVGLVCAISFENATNPDGGVAVLAMNIFGGVPGCEFPLGDVNRDGIVFC